MLIVLILILSFTVSQIIKCWKISKDITEWKLGFHYTHSLHKCNVKHRKFISISATYENRRKSAVNLTFLL